MACHDDDDKQKLDLSAANYSGDHLALSLNGITLNGRTVSLQPQNGAKAEISLHSFLPGEEQTKVLVEGVQNGAVVILLGEDKNEGRSLSIVGEIEDGKLSLQASVQVHSDIVGTWKFPDGNQVPDDRLNNSAVYIDLVNSQIQTIKLPGYLYNGNKDENNQPIYDYPQTAFIEEPGDGKGIWFAERVMNGALSNFYSSLVPELEFKANGHIGLTIVPWGGDEPITLPEGILRYGVRAGKIWLTMEAAGETPGMEIALLLKQENGRIKLAIDKELLDTYIMFSPYLKALLNYQNEVDMFPHGKTTEESVRVFVDQDMLQLLRGTASFELGINLLSK